MSMHGEMCDMAVREMTEYDGHTKEEVKRAARIIAHGSSLTTEALAEVLGRAQTGSPWVPEYEAFLHWVREAGQDWEPRENEIGIEHVGG